MAKNPVLPLYFNDILGSTKTWSDEEFGAYVRLLIHQWDHKELPKDYQRLTRIATSLDTNWKMISKKFKETETGLQNERMEIIRAKMIKHSENQSNNVSVRYQNSTKLLTKNLPLEIEYEKELENEFDIFRKKYPGRKNGLKIEYDNYKKKNKDWIVNLTKLLPALEKEIIWRSNLINANQFVPSWKDLSTWINKKCWLQELNIENIQTKKSKTQTAFDTAESVKQEILNNKNEQILSLES